MNVIYVLHNTDMYAGASKALAWLLREICKKEVNPIVILPGKDGLYQVFSAMGIEVYSVPVRPNIYPRKFRGFKNIMMYIPRLVYWHLLNLFSYIWLVRKFRDRHIDLIHTNVSVIDVGYKLSRAIHVPHVFHIREYGTLDFGIHYFPSKKSFHNKFTSPNNYTICITQDVQKHHSLGDENNSFVIYDGVCPLSALFKSLTDKKYFLYAGRIEPAKGLLPLIKAYREYVLLDVASDVVPLYVAGGVSDTKYYEEVRNAVSRGGISEHVHFLGQRDDIASLMQEARAIIIPSLHEGFGFCMTEAMFNGCLVIGRDTGGTKEQFDNGRKLKGKDIGLRYKDEDDLVEQLKTVAVHPKEFYSEMISDAASTVCQLYSIEACSNNIYNLYKKIIDYKS